MIIHEYRLKCDYPPCENVSPVIGDTVADHDNAPPGWIVDYNGAPHAHYHFCCGYHYRLWLEAKEKENAKI